MKTVRMLAGSVAVFLMFVTGIQAQEKAKATEAEKPSTPLVLQVVFSEYQGEKKVSSLPYILPVNADGSRVILRMGLRVPFATKGGQNLPMEFQWQDVGTNIDCEAHPVEGGRFRLALRTERSSLYTPGPDKEPDDRTLPSQPIFSRFSADFNLTMRDGQTIQSTVATDPVSGRALKTDVTLHMVK